MDTSNANASVTRQDRNAINHKLLHRLSAAPLASVESAGRIVKMHLSSPEGKRLFLRFFDITQLHMHYVSKIARLSLPDAEVEAVEQQVLDLIVEKTQVVDQEMVRVEQQLRSHHIDSLATYAIEPLVLDARVLGKIGRRLLELIGKVDQLMPMLETMAIDELISESQLNIKKSVFKKTVRSVAGVVRTLKSGLQKKSLNLSKHDKPSSAFQSNQGGPQVEAGMVLPVEDRVIVEELHQSVRTDATPFQHTGQERGVLDNEQDVSQIDAPILVNHPVIALAR